MGIPPNLSFSDGALRYKHPYLYIASRKKEEVFHICLGSEANRFCFRKGCEERRKRLENGPQQWGPRGKRRSCCTMPSEMDESV